MYFSSAFFSIVKLSAKLGLVLFLFLSLSGVSQARIEKGESIAIYLKGNVVTIEATPRGKPPRYGFGFIIGEQGNSYAIVTADHVVRSYAPEDDNTEISVSYFSQNNTSYPAELANRHDEHFDLAVIYAGKPVSHQWKKKALADSYDITRSEKVWFVGRDNDWYVPTDSGKIYEVGLHRLFIEKLNARKGSSGAPLISNTGIIGMLLFDLSSSTSDITKALSLKNIQEAMSLWNDVPWQLEPSILSHSGKNKIQLQLKKAKEKTKQLFAAFERLDIETMVSICGYPVAFDHAQFNTASELRSHFQKYKEERGSSSSNQSRILDIYASMSILEAVSNQGWKMEGSFTNRLFDKLDLGYEDIAVLFRVGQTEDNVKEGVMFYRIIGNSVKLVFVSG